MFCSDEFYISFCKEIGLNDFNELRELLITTNMTFEQYSTSSKAKDRLKEYSSKVKESITMVEKSIDIQQIDALCKEIQKYEQVGIFGLLKAGAVAFNLQSDLLMLGKQTYSNISYKQQLQYISSTNEDDLLIIFSYTGSYFDYPDIRTLKNQLKKPQIWLISSKQESYPEFIDHVITFDSKQDQNSHPYQLQFIASLIAQEYARRVNPPFLNLGNLMFYRSTSYIFLLEVKMMINKSYKHWMIVFLMCCLAASSIGLCTNAIGVFYTPVSKSLHVLKGTFAMHATLSTLITALTSLKMSKLIRKYNYKRFFL